MRVVEMFALNVEDDVRVQVGTFAPRRVPNRAKSRGELPLLITPPRFPPLEYLTLTTQHVCSIAIPTNSFTIARILDLLSMLPLN
jgi:hypothetical protein